MAEECPNCGAPFSDRVTVEMGDRYEGVFGPPPASLFSTYVRLCPNPRDARLASRDPNVTVDVFLHEHGDIGPAPASGD